MQLCSQACLKPDSPLRTGDECALAGNLLRTPDGKIAILDYGLMTTVPPDYSLALVEYIAHLSGKGRGLPGFELTLPIWGCTHPRRGQLPLLPWASSVV